MRLLKLIFITMVLSSCSNSEKPTVKKLNGMTSTGNAFVKDFYLIDPPPGSVKELKELMLKTSRSKIHHGFEREVYVFIRENDDEGTPFLSSYEKDETQGVAPEDILGSVEFENIGRQRILIEVEINE